MATETAIRDSGTSGSATVYLREVWKAKWWLVLGTLLPMLAALAYSLTAEPVYRVSVLTKVVSGEEMDAVGQAFGSLNAISGLVGLPAIRGNSDRTESIAFLKSRSLAEDFIESQGLRPLLFSSSWDPANQRWKEPGIAGPGRGRTVREFWKRILRVEEEPATGLVRVEFRWTDPVVAADWANKFVHLANSRLQARAIDFSKQRIRYLREELDRSEDIQLKQAIYRLMQTEINSAMVANVRKDFAFSIIDPATPPDQDDPWWPRKLPILVMTGVFSLLAALGLLAVFNHVWRSDRQQ